MKHFKPRPILLSVESVNGKFDQFSFLSNYFRNNKKIIIVSIKMISIFKINLLVDIISKSLITFLAL